MLLLLLLLLDTVGPSCEIREMMRDRLRTVDYL